MVSEKLQLVIDLQNKLFNSKLKQTQDNFNKASNGLMGKANKLSMNHARAFGAMTNQFPAIASGMDLLADKYVLMAGLAAGIGIGVAKSISLGIKNEMQTTSFEVLLGGKKAAEGLVNELAEYAKKTPYEKLGLGDAAKMMLGFGIAQEKVMPNLKMLGDLAMGDAQKLEQLTRAFSQSASAGKLTGEDLNQMIDAGFNPLQEMSKLTGKSMSELKGSMEDGRISFAMVEETFKSVTGEGGKFHNMADKMSQTVGGKASSMFDAFNDVLLSVYNVVQPLLLPVLNGLTYGLENLIPTVSWLFSEFQNGNPILFGLAFVIGLVTSAMIFNTIATSIAGFKAKWLLGTTRLQAIWSGISAIKTGLMTVATYASIAATTLLTMFTNKAVMAMQLKAMWSGIVTGALWLWNAAQKALNLALNANPIGVIIILIGLLVVAIIEVVNNWDYYVAKWNAGWTLVKNAAQIGWLMLKSNFTNIGFDLMILWNKFKGFGQWIGGFFSNIGKSIKLAFSGDFSGAKDALFAPIKIGADAEIKRLESVKNKLYQENQSQQKKLLVDSQQAAKTFLYGPKTKKSEGEKKIDALNQKVKTEEKKGGTTFNDLDDKKSTKGRGKGGNAIGDQVNKVTGAGGENKNITINIDSLVKGGINTANTTLAKMDAKELEKWFTEMLLRTIRAAELTI
jgi:tape measure domain-containing protein